MKWSQITDVGLVREDNEDSLLSCEDIGLFVVADGMGGHKAGEVASKKALEYLEKMVRQLLNEVNDPGKVLLESFKQANSSVYDLAKHDVNLEGMGTTVTACLLRNDEVLVAHVGDSRAYLLRDKKIRQVTDDHSLVGELVKNGAISEESARTHPRRNVLTQAVGVMPTVDTDLYHLTLNPGDKLLLCTDGLTNHLEREKINEIVLKSNSLEQGVKNLADFALAQGGTDNVSIILIEI